MIDIRIAAHLLFFERDSDISLENGEELDNRYRNHFLVREISTATAAHLPHVTTSKYWSYPRARRQEVNLRKVAVANRHLDLTAVARVQQTTGLVQPCGSPTLNLLLHLFVLLLLYSGCRELELQRISGTGQAGPDRLRHRFCPWSKALDSTRQSA
jgi:hypothetical protein